MKLSDNLKAYLILEAELAPVVDESPDDLLDRLHTAWHALTDEELEWLTNRGNMEETK